MERRDNQKLWEVALREAAGVFSSYLTPSEYGLSTLSVQAAGADPNALFLRQVQKRLDLGRTESLAKRLAGVHVSTSYRHQIFLRDDRIDGQIHVPRWLVARAANPEAPVPVIRATRKPITPENLFVSEAVNRGLAICRSWFGVDGPERELAQRVFRQLRGFEAKSPWADLRCHPRPSFSALAAAVRTRLIAGMVRAEPIATILNLLDPKTPTPSGFETAASLMALPLTSDEEFADRLFELLCLAWIVEALRPHLHNVAVWPDNLKRAAGRPVLEGQLTNGQLLRIHYQTGIALPQAQWTYVPSGKPLGGIIDILIQVGGEDHRQLILIDAKNRSISQEGPVFYKMLGYQQNYQIPLYAAVVIFPTSDDSTRIKALTCGDHRIWSLCVPLDRGRAIFSALVKGLLRQS